MERIQQTYAAMLSLAAEMILDESMKQQRMRRIYEEIDRALDRKDSQRFFQLTEELKAIG